MVEKIKLSIKELLLSVSGAINCHGVSSYSFEEIAF